MNRWRWYSIPLMAACISTLAVADDRADYNRRPAERYIAIFHLADLNNFNDLDSDNTWGELTQYLEATFR